MKTKIFVVAGLKNGDVEYLAFDIASGGYPYLSKIPRDVTFDKAKAISWLEDASGPYVTLENPKVYELSLMEV